MTTPEVSVICPLYKRTRFIDAMMAGMFAQTLVNWELIFVDDGSDMPELTEICLRYEKQDKRVRYIQLPKNRGVSAALNYGFAEASAEFIASHDDDDIYFPQWLEKLTGCLRQNPQVGAVACFYVRIDEMGKITARDFTERISAQPLIYEVNPPLTPVDYAPSCFRRSCFMAIGGYDTDFVAGGEDVDIALRLQEKYPFAVWREAELHCYRFHKSGASHLSGHPHIWRYVTSALLAAYFRRNNLPDRPAIGSRELLAYAKFLSADMMRGTFKIARGGHKRLLRREQYTELENMLGDFRTAFAYSKKYRRKMHCSLLAWCFYYGKLGALPAVIKSMLKS